MKKRIDIKVVDWWRSFNKKNFKNNSLIHILRKHLGHKFKFNFSNNPKYLLYNSFDDSHLDYDKDCIRIFYTGENIRTDWNLADYGIDYDLLDFDKRHLCFPLYFLYTSDLKNAVKMHLLSNDKREKFCSFMVSNGGADKIRDEFFEKLCEYKKVDSGGRWKNNIGGAFIEDKNAWLKNYKFNLCFENSSQKGYVTEKIIQAFAAGCVPIYWGDGSLCDEKYAKFRPVFNPKAFINVHNFDSIESAIKEIERIDNDDSAFEAMRKEPIFSDNSMEKFFGVSPKTHNIWSAENINSTAEFVVEKSQKILASFFDNIFTKGEKQIKYGQHLQVYFEQRKSDRERRLKFQPKRKKLRQIEDFFTYIPKKIRTLWRKALNLKS